MTKSIGFKKATRININIRVALCGATGSGKSYTAFSIASVIAEGGKVAVIDTERSSSDRYAHKFDFDNCVLTSFHPDAYIAEIDAAAQAGYRVLVIDSLSHAWDGTDGLLEQHNAITKRQRVGNSFTAWRDATPIHNRLIDAVLDFPGHVIVTMRSKMEYVQEKDSNGKTVINKIGMAPIQRAGVEYEFDIVGDMDQDHNLVITKSRAEDLDRLVANKPGAKFANQLLAWAKGGVPSTTTRPLPTQQKSIEPAAIAATAPTTEPAKTDNQSITETPIPTPPAANPPAKETKSSNTTPDKVDDKTWLGSFMGAIGRNAPLQTLALKVRNEMNIKSFSDLRTAAPEIIGAFREKLGAERKAKGV